MPDNALFRQYQIADRFCAPQCAVVDESGRPLYFDDNHLTLTGVARIEPVIARAVEEGLAMAAAQRDAVERPLHRRLGFDDQFGSSPQ